MVIGISVYTIYISYHTRIYSKPARHRLSQWDYILLYSDVSRVKLVSKGIEYR